MPPAAKVQQKMTGIDWTEVGYKSLAGGIGCAISGFATNPMDCIKVMNQQYGGNFYGTGKKIWADEGYRGFFKGGSCTLAREMTYSALRMGLYEPLKYGLSETTGLCQTGPHIKWASSFLSGAIGSALFNPIDLVKVRYQSRLPHQVNPYNGIVHAHVTIYKQGGLEALYKGTSATVFRAALLTSSQLGTYDIVKNNILVKRCGFDREGNTTHFTSSMLTSVVATTASNPPDVVKTRVMNDGERKIGGPMAHAAHMLKTEGASAFMRGWTASYCRIGPHTIMSFVLVERTRQLLGHDTY